MKSFQFPSFIVGALLVGGVAVLQHVLLNINSLGLKELYIPVAVVILNTIIKMFQEAQASEASPRGLDTLPQRSYLARVFV